MAFCRLYGLSDHWHQTLILGRHSDLFDFLQLLSVQHVLFY
ncbi:MAG: VanZ family protein [Methylococcales bacterium]